MERLPDGPRSEDSRLGACTLHAGSLQQLRLRTRSTPHEHLHVLGSMHFMWPEGVNYAALASVRPEPLRGGLAALRRPSSEACAGPLGRPPRAAQAQVSRPTRADRRDDGALVVTRAAHGRLRHEVAADRAEVETAA